MKENLLKPCYSSDLTMVDGSFIIKNCGHILRRLDKRMPKSLPFHL